MNHFTKLFERQDKNITNSDKLGGIEAQIQIVSNSVFSNPE